MSKFSATKTFSLDFLGDKWGEAYIKFESITVGDVKNKFPKLAKVDPQNTDTITEGIDKLLELLQEKFIDGKAPDSSGNLVILKKEDLEDLPAEVIGRSVSFLAQGLTPESSTP